jgi:ERCC4-type nuclease
MKALIDHRERKVAKLIEGLFGEIKVISLPLGDVLLTHGEEAVIVERKTITDFFSSVRSNRLWDQLLRLMKLEEILGFKVKRRILLLDGDFEGYLEPFGEASSAKGIQVFWSQIMGALLKIIYVYDTPIIVAENNEALRAFFKTLARREETGLNDKLPTARWYRKRPKTDLPVKDRKRYVLSALPLIGETLAKNLLEHFGTISNIANASVEELREVPKIGKKKAETIYEIFHSSI